MLLQYHSKVSYHFLSPFSWDEIIVSQEAVRSLALPGTFTIYVTVYWNVGLEVCHVCSYISTSIHERQRTKILRNYFKGGLCPSDSPPNNKQLSDWEKILH